MAKDGTTAKIKATATVLDKELRDAFKHIERVIEKRATIPVLGCVRVVIGPPGRIDLMATDLDMFVEVGLGATTIGKQTCLIPANVLSSFVKVATGTVSISIEERLGEDFAVLKADHGLNVAVRLHIRPDDFPLPRGDAFHAVSRSAQLSAGADDWRRLLRLTRHCISTEETRFYLNGLYLCAKPDGDTLRGVATDGHRLAVVDTELRYAPSDDEALIVPTKMVDAMLQAVKPGANEPVAISFAERSIVMKHADITITSKVIDGDYPDYIRVIPAPEWKYEVSLSKAQVGSLAAFSSFGGGPNFYDKAVAFDAAERVARIKSIGAELTAEIPVQVNGEVEPKPWGFNIKYLRDQVKVTDPMTIRGRDRAEPHTVVGDDPLAMWVIMPMRV